MQKSSLYPNELISSTYKIDFEKLYREGFRGLIFDIDNTLVPHGFPADQKAIRLFARLKQIGFQCCLLSNNDQERVEMFNREIQVHTLHKAGKPFAAGYRKAMDLMGTTVSNTVFIGDQIFTDVWGASRIGIFTILVRPIHPKEEIQIVLKRLLEKPIIGAYLRSRHYSAAHEIQNIVLIGFMGAGKTTIGKACAQMQDAAFLDTDELIMQKTGMKITEIFEKKGENCFRQQETKLLRALADRKDRFVLSVGGGVPLRDENRPLLRKIGRVIWLKSSAEVLEERLKNDTSRPLLQQGEGSLREKIERILSEREEKYADAADVVIENTGKTITEVVMEITDLC